MVRWLGWPVDGRYLVARGGNHGHGHGHGSWSIPILNYLLPIADRARTHNLHLDCGLTDTNNSNQHRNSVCMSQTGGGVECGGKEGSYFAKAKTAGTSSPRGVKPRTADRTGTRSCAELEKMMHF